MSAAESSIDERLTLVVDTPTAQTADFATSVRDGLSSEAKTLPCRWLYDDCGSKLFEDICAQPEYYVTRAEAEILGARADALAERVGPEARLAELGSGSAEKTELLIDAMLDHQGELLYMPVDISRSALEESSRDLLARHPKLTVHGIAGVYERGLEWLARPSDQPTLVLFLGGNVGNLTRDEAARFLATIAGSLAREDRLAVGIDLRKEREVLERAYDDAAGVTAAFNLNMLTRINTELGGHFDLDGFRHEARWNEARGVVELGLVSTRDQQVAIDALELTVSFRAGERIHTEDSTKYSRAEIEALAGAAGLALEEHWLDQAGRFSLNLLAPVTRAG